MSFIEFRMKIPPASADAVLGRLHEMGSTGTFERGNSTFAYFESGRDTAAICGELEALRETLEKAGLDPGFSFEYEELPDQDWNENWKRNFTPIDVGENLTIVPSWLSAETKRIPIIIDPGMVFGTGHHPTTRTCLSFIEKYSGRTQKNSFLDIGAGTGILAVGAAKVGFGKVVGVDTDPLCVEAASNNASANGLDNVEIICGDVRAVEGVFDFIAANLLSEILKDIAAELAARLREGGVAVLSGMMEGQDRAVLEEMERQGLHLIEKKTDDNWATLVVGKKPAESGSP